MMYTKAAIWTSILLTIIVTQPVRADESQQISVSPTPVPINLPSPVFDAPQPGAITVTPTRTATPPGPAMLEALTEANVRAEPDTAGALLGTIRSGDLYPIMGRYYRWIRFQYDPMQNGGIGWVFDELVRIVGDEASIPDLAAEAVPTLDSTALDLTATLEAITQMPGGVLTLTANARILPAPGLSLPGQGNSAFETTPEVLGAPIMLPTFTYPADVAASAPREAISLDNPFIPTATPVSIEFTLTVSEGMPPILPVLLLGGLGILGLILSSLRR